MMTVGAGRVADEGACCDEREMACRFSVALSNHGDRFGQATSRVCTINMCLEAIVRIVDSRDIVEA